MQNRTPEPNPVLQVFIPAELCFHFPGVSWVSRSTGPPVQPNSCSCQTSDVQIWNTLDPFEESSIGLMIWKAHERKHYIGSANLKSTEEKTTLAKLFFTSIPKKLCKLRDFIHSLTVWHHVSHSNSRWPMVARKFSASMCCLADISLHCCRIRPYLGMVTFHGMQPCLRLIVDPLAQPGKIQSGSKNRLYNQASVYGMFALI